MQIGRSYLGVPSCMTKYRYIMVRIKIHKSKIMSGTWMPLEAVEVGQVHKGRSYFGIPSCMSKYRFVRVWISILTSK